MPYNSLSQKINPTMNFKLYQLHVKLLCHLVIHSCHSFRKLLAIWTFPLLPSSDQLTLRATKLPRLVWVFFFLLVLVRSIQKLKPRYFCGLLTYQNIPATGNSFPAADHARAGNKQSCCQSGLLHWQTHRAKQALICAQCWGATFLLVSGGVTLGMWDWNVFGMCQGVRSTQCEKKKNTTGSFLIWIQTACPHLSMSLACPRPF